MAKGIARYIVTNGLDANAERTPLMAIPVAICPT